MYFKNIFCYFPGTEVDHKQSFRIYLEKKKKDHENTYYGNSNGTFG